MKRNFVNSICGLAKSFLISAGFVFGSAHADVPTRTPQEIRKVCLKANHREMSRRKDIAGLLSWGALCVQAYRNSENQLPFMYLIALSEIEVGRIAHEFRTSNRTDDQNWMFSDPQRHLVSAREVLDDIERRGAATGPLRSYLSSMQRYIRTSAPVQKITTDSMACLLNYNSLNDKSSKLKLAHICALAYNKRPLGVLAYNYSGTMLFVASMIATDEPDNLTQAYRAAEIAYVFSRRAEAEGWRDLNFPPETINTVRANIGNRIVNNDLNKVNAAIIGVFAALVIPEVVLGSGEREVTRTFIVEEDPVIISARNADEIVTAFIRRRDEALLLQTGE